MNIKEIETRTGLERANIYFYEKEGLITPDRLQNGYRDYSEEDLKILMKIKLLRSLHISLEDIHSLMNGSLSLNDTMNRQIQELAKEEEKADYARQLCESIRDAKVSFGNLNAEKYLNKGPEPPKPEENPYFSLPVEVFPQTLFPWKRFFARAFDELLYFVLVRVLFRLIFGFSVSDIIGFIQYAFFFIDLGVLLLIEPLLLHFLGTTPGKALWGLSIQTLDGQNLSFKDGYKRTWGVIRKGLALYIPILNLIYLYKCYNRCTDHRLQDWEVDIPIQYTCKDNCTTRPIGFAVGCAILFAALGLASLPQTIAPNTGNLTIEELVENYNHFAEYYNYEYDQATLMPYGQWEEKGASEEYDRYPTYQYKTDSRGNVSEVSFTMEITGNDATIDYPEDQILLLTMAMMYSDPQVGLSNQVPNDLFYMVSANDFGDFSIMLNGVIVESTCEYEGYLKPQGQQLRPNIMQEDRYFKLTFRCTKN